MVYLLPIQNKQYNRTIMYIKAKHNKSDGQTNIDKYRITEHILLQNNISKSWFDIYIIYVVKDIRLEYM